MKNISLLITILLFSISSYSQDSLKNIISTYKPTPKENSMELKFDPSKIFADSDFNGQFGLLSGGIKYRYFKTKSSAYRMLVDITYLRNTNIIQQSDTDFSRLELKEVLNYNAVYFKPGYEKHFKGTKRLSPYIGGQFLIGYDNLIIETEKQIGDEIYTETVKNPWSTTVNNGQKGFSLGLEALAGFDYYFAEKLYLGLEVTYGVSYIKKFDEEFIDSYDSSNNETIKRGNYFSMTTRLATANFRIGWVFKKKPAANKYDYERSARPSDESSVELHPRESAMYLLKGLIFFFWL